MNIFLWMITCWLKHKSHAEQLFSKHHTMQQYNCTLDNTKLTTELLTHNPTKSVAFYPQCPTDPFWPTVLSVALLAQCVICLSVICLSVMFCIVVKQYVLAKNCLKERIGNQGQKVDFLGRRHIPTSGFAAMATEMAVLPYFCPYSPQSVLDGINGLSSSKRCTYRIETGSSFSHDYWPRKV